MPSFRCTSAHPARLHPALTYLRLADLVCQQLATCGLDCAPLAWLSSTLEMPATELEIALKYALHLGICGHPARDHAPGAGRAGQGGQVAGRGGHRVRPVAPGADVRADRWAATGRRCGADRAGWSGACGARRSAGALVDRAGRWRRIRRRVDPCWASCSASAAVVTDMDSRTPGTRTTATRSTRCARRRSSRPAGESWSPRCSNSPGARTCHPRARCASCSGGHDPHPRRRVRGHQAGAARRGDRGAARARGRSAFGRRGDRPACGRVGAPDCTPAGTSRYSRPPIKCTFSPSSCGIASMPGSSCIGWRHDLMTRVFEGRPGVTAMGAARRVRVPWIGRGI